MSLCFSNSTFGLSFTLCEFMLFGIFLLSGISTRQMFDLEAVVQAVVVFCLCFCFCFKQKALCAVILWLTFRVSVLQVGRLLLWKIRLRSGLWYYRSNNFLKNF